MEDPSETAPEPGKEPSTLRFLRLLVTVLTVVMICGVVVVVGLLVTRLSGDRLPLPEEIDLPEGAKAQSLTIGADWYLVVTDDHQILIFDRVTGRLRKTVAMQ